MTTDANSDPILIPPVSEEEEKNTAVSIKPAKRSRRRSKPKPEHHDVDNRYKGVHLRSTGKWVAQISEPSKRSRHWLGTYATAEEAARVYDSAAILLFGSKAELNYVDEGGPSSKSKPPTLSPPSTKPHTLELIVPPAFSLTTPPPPGNNSVVGSQENNVPMIRAEAEHADAEFHVQNLKYLESYDIDHENISSFLESPWFKDSPPPAAETSRWAAALGLGVGDFPKIGIWDY